jgi:hypothetical protein
MGKAKKLGQFKPFLPNSRADMRRMKQYRRNREYTDRHEAVLDQNRDKRLMKEKRYEENSYNV